VEWNKSDRLLVVKRKILILANGLPVYQGGHSDILLNQIKDYGALNFCYFSTRRLITSEKPEILREIPTKIAPLRILEGKIIKNIPMLEEIIYCYLIIKRKREIILFSKRHNVKLVYAILRGDTLPLVNYLIDKMELPLVAYVPDTVEAEWTDKKLIYKLKRKNYYKAIRKSKIIAAPGESMAEYFKKIFYKDSVIFRPGLESKIIPENQRESFKSNLITLGFAGSLYAKEEFVKFLYSLHIFVKKHSDFKIKILFISNFEPELIDDIVIESYGWCSQEEVLKILSKADIGYLPYKFDERYKTQMQLAFPSKIASYLAAKTPVFFHGPSYSSVNYFLKKHQCGVSCDSMNENDIVVKLEKLVFDEKFYDSCKKLCVEAYKQEFTKEKMTENFKYFINKGLE